MNLGKCNLNDESVKIFVKCNFPEIQTLNFRGNKFSDKFLQIIVSQKLNKLKKVVLSHIHLNGQKFKKRINKFTFLNTFKMDENNKRKG